MSSLKLNEVRVYRTIAFPVSVFDKLKAYQRAHSIGTNAEAVTRLILQAEGAGLLSVAQVAETPSAERSPRESAACNSVSNPILRAASRSITLLFH